MDTLVEMKCPSCESEFVCGGHYDMDEEVWKLNKQSNCPACGEAGLMKNGAGYVNANDGE